MRASREDLRPSIHLPGSAAASEMWSNGGCHVEAWLRHSAGDPGPLSCLFSQTGEAHLTRLCGESMAYILRHLHQKVGTRSFSPRDLRRNFMTSLLDDREEVFTGQKLTGHAGVRRYNPKLCMEI